MGIHNDLFWLGALRTLALVASLAAAADDVIANFDFTAGDAHDWQPINNLTAFDLSQGVLATRATGNDAHMMVTGLSLPAAAITHVAVRMRSSQPGPTQIYYATSDNPALAGKPVPTASCPGNGEWHDVSVRLQGLSGFSGTLTRLRIDPVQGANDAEIEIQSIRLLRLSPRPRVERFSPEILWLPVGAETRVTLSVANQGGPLTISSVAAGLDAYPATAIRFGVPRISPAADGLGVRIVWSVRGMVPGSVRLRASLRIADHADVTAETILQVGPPTAANADLVSIADGHLTVSLLTATDGTVSTALLSARTPSGWRLVGTLLPLAHLAVTGEGSAWAEDLSFEVEDRGRRTLELVARRPWGRCRLKLKLRRNGQVEVRADLRPDGDIGLLRFSGPMLRLGFGAHGADKEAAVFPGQEFLGPGARSSDIEVVGDTLYYRPSPDPRTVTVPVPAVLRDGILSGMMWDPLQDWGIENGGMPVAEFASPNFLDGQPNHLIGCSLPGLPWRQPNTGSAREPCKLRRGQTLRLRTRVFALPGKGIIEAVPLWYDVYGQPPPPKAAHGNRECLDLLMRGYGETLWDAGAKGFVTHRNFGDEKPVWRPSFAARLLTHHLRTGETRWIRAVGLEPGESLLDVLGSMFRAPVLPPPPDFINEQTPEGHWPYKEATSHDVAAYSGGFKDRLGEEGAFYNGYTGTKFLNPLLHHASRWGDERALKAAIMSLEALMDETVPKGAQTWEVPAETPDLYGAARLADCFLMGFRLTGDRRYLDKARYWLYCGLPFLYAYALPETGNDIKALVDGRQINASVYLLDIDGHPYTPWGSIPVFGTSLYRVNWFGTLVHFCGLVWAGSVFDYLELIDDPLLAAAAAGVTRVGVNLTLDRSPYVGLLPDGVDVRINRVQGALIGPMRVEPPLRRVMGLPAFAGAGVVVWRYDGGRVHVQSSARLVSAHLSRRVWTWRQEYLRDQTCETMVVRCIRQPVGVSVGRRELPQVSDLTAVDEGWSPLPAIEGFGFRVHQRRKSESITVHFADGD